MDCGPVADLGQNRLSRLDGLHDARSGPDLGQTGLSRLDSLDDARSGPDLDQTRQSRRRQIWARSDIRLPQEFSTLK